MRSLVNKAAVAAAAPSVSSLVAGAVHATTVSTTWYKGRMYAVDVMPCGSTADVVFRVKANTSSAGDIYIGTLSRSTASVRPSQTLQQAASAVCSAKRVLDAGKTVLGCGATIGSAISLVAAVPSGGASALVCSATIAYAANSGLRDCVIGVADKIGRFLAGERNWKAAATIAGVSTGSWSAAIDNAIDPACIAAK